MTALVICPTCNGSGYLAQGAGRLQCTNCQGVGAWLENQGTRLFYQLPLNPALPSAITGRLWIENGVGSIGALTFLAGAYGILTRTPHTLAATFWTQGLPNAAFGLGGLLSAAWLTNHQQRQRSPLSLHQLKLGGQPIRLNDYANPRLNLVISQAAKEAHELGRGVIDEEILLITLLDSPRIQGMISRLEKDAGDLSTELRRLYAKARPPEKTTTKIGWLPEVSLRYQKACLEAIEHDFPYVESEGLLLSLLKEPGRLEPFFKNHDLHYEEFLAVSGWFAHDEERHLQLAFWMEKGRSRPNSYMNRAWTALPTRFLDQYSTDITRLAAGGHLPSAKARTKEVDQVLAILGRTQKNSALLVGEPGVGKNTVLGAVAQRMVESNVPDSLQDKRLVSLDLGSLLANAAEAQQNLQRVIDEVLAAGNVILAIPEVNLLVGTGQGGLDAASLLAEGLSRGSLQLVTTASYGDYHRYVESNQSLSSVLEKVEVKELSEEQAVAVLEEEAPGIEARLGVVLTYPAIATAVTLARRYLPEQVLPSSALSLIDETAAALRLRKERWVSKEEIAKEVETKTGVPVNENDQAHMQLVLNLEQELHSRIVGQDEAVTAVAEAIRRASAGLHGNERPVASFLFVGPTGVGKTEVARTLTKLYYGDEKLMIRLDMSEYQEGRSIDRLIGPTAGSTDSRTEGGTLTQPVREHPHSLILLDEIEKAHPDVLNLFLQLMEDGRLTENTGRTVSYANCIVIATSNASSPEVAQLVGQGITGDDLSRRVINLLQNSFRPELLNRFDRIVPFRALTPEQVAQIAGIMLADISHSMAEKQYTVTFAPEAVALLAKAGYDPAFGARPLRRVIQDKVEGLLARLILEHRLLPGQSLQVTSEMIQ